MTHPHLHHRFYLEHPVNTFYLSLFIMNIAENLISVFIPIYLHSLEYSIPLIIFFFFLGNLGSVLLSAPGTRLVGTLGPKHAMILSMPFFVAYYAGLRFLPQFPILFCILPFFIATRSVLYNLGFGVAFVHNSNRKRLGSAVSWFQIVAIAGTSFAPLFAGVIIILFGYSSLFLAGCALLVLSCIPLLQSQRTGSLPDHTHLHISRAVADPRMRRIHWSFVGYAIESVIGRVVWPLFLVLVVGSVVSVGSIVTAATIVTVVLLFVIGAWTDHHKSKTILSVATILYFFGWIASPIADNPFRAFFIEIYRRVSERCIIVPWSAAFYRALPARNLLAGLAAQDLIFNLSRVIILPIIIAVFLFSSSPFTITFAIASIGTLLYPLVIQKSKGQSA